ncbi:MAG: type II toxin-antitoxin system RelE/ParE family toxin [Muribaculaceae bacterium]|nr:type II toxin-antitoxin system RelE/ParE family toxin [Muribaculaceae bacterium]MDE5958296.1 type II toxin-antitoxin system RelE/ParE family toxin [Muribaculaceae bacterium]
MSFEIIPTPDFERSFKALAKRHRSLKQDILDFAKSLQENPFQGDELSPGIRKIRMSIASKGRGKSGGARVITYTLVVAENEGRVYLMDIYDKADYSTVDVAMIKEIVRYLGLAE